MLAEMVFEGYRPQSTHLGLIADLAQQDGQRQQDLAIATVKDKATVARALHQLEEEAFVERRVDPYDRRQRRIYLTPRGARLWSYADDFSRRFLGRVTGDVTEADLRNCLRVLRRVHGTLHQQLTTPSVSPQPHE